MALERIARCRGREVPRTKYYVPSTRRQTAARPPATPHPGSLQIANCGRAEGPTSCVISPKSGDPGLSGTLRLRTRGDRLRWVTYLSLVLRRVGARRLMLLGSLLGATLVTALLVVLPLYEASVSAVDLLFTFRQAPDATVDLTAVYSTNAFSATESDAARLVVADATEPIAEWYPDVSERTISREFILIPLADPEEAAV